MKKIYYIGLSMLSMLSFSSCSDLDLAPEGATITEEQKDWIEEQDPAKFEAVLNGMYETVNKTQVFSTAHTDFGYPSMCLMWDINATDIACLASGYNQYQREATFEYRSETSTHSNFVWSLLYKQIGAANRILRSATKGNTELAGYRGQALAVRAFDYLNLAQTYQFTYDGHENDLSVVYVDEDMTPEQILNNPRITVKELYAKIFQDLDEAIELLPLGSSTKSYVNKYVAYGLRARANLLTKNWSAAVKDADEVLKKPTRPYTIEELKSSPRFYTMEDASWLWAISITKDSDPVQSGILNWPSMLSSMTGNGYTTLVTRRINQPLWDKIPSTDIRKGWWLDANLSSPVIDDKKIMVKEKEEPLKNYFRAWRPYTNVKFGPSDGKYGNTTNSSDWPLMRVEEILLIKAEAEARDGSLSTGKATLESFLQTYRDPSYTCAATTLDDFIDEVWIQRRVELWGEGFALFDILRLKKPVERVVSGTTTFISTQAINVPAEDPILLWRIPRSEMQTNKGIQENNKVTPIPSPVL